MPTVSVIIPSYNHSRFIGEAIESLINQTYTDFEIIIVDDCSPDNSVEVIRTFTDPRIKLFVNKRNEGAVYTTNKAIQLATGDYVALLNSDDMWVPNKLEVQVEFLQKNPDVHAVFSNAKFVNEDQKELKKADYFWADVFEKENRSSAEWLRYFFFDFNCLCHPSILIRREVYDRTPLYDPSLRQLPDFKMWVHLLKTINIFVMPEALVVFRVLMNGENASADTTSNRVRTRNEIYLIMKDFFDDMSMERFKEGFGDLLQNKNFTSEEHFKCEKAFMYLNFKTDVAYIYQLIALEKFHELLREEVTRTLLEKDYGYTYRDYFEMTGRYELLDASQKTITNIVLDTAKKQLQSKGRAYRWAQTVYHKMRARK